jgi:hypothetical protein
LKLGQFLYQNAKLSIANRYWWFRVSIVESGSQRERRAVATLLPESVYGVFIVCGLPFARCTRAACRIQICCVADHFVTAELLESMSRLEGLDSSPGKRIFRNHILAFLYPLSQRFLCHSHHQDSVYRSIIVSYGRIGCVTSAPQGTRGVWKHCS